MARKTAPNFEFVVNGMQLFEVENVSDIDLAGPLAVVTSDEGVNAYPSARCVLIAHANGEMQAFIPGSGHVADFTLAGLSLGVAPGALGVLLAQEGNGWSFIGGALNFEVTAEDGVFTVDGIDVDNSQDDGEDAVEEEAEEEPEPAPARGRGRPPKAAAPAEEPKRGRGRPPGAKNKPKEEEAPAPRRTVAARPAPARSGFRR